MGIFNTNIFKELKEGLENFSEKVKKNFNEGKEEQEEIITKCPNCGANLNTSLSKCNYCGATLNVKNKTKKVGANSTKIKYPVLVELNDNGFCAYDCQTDYCSDTHKSVAEALEQIQEELQDILDDGDSFYPWTEKQFLEDSVVQKAIKKGSKMKFIELDYIDPEKDPDW